MARELNEEAPPRRVVAHVIGEALDDLSVRDFEERIASWLLLQRAINEGEMSQAEAASDKRRTRLAWQHQPTKANALEALPQALIVLIDKSVHLQTKILRLDQMMSEPTIGPAALSGPNPVDQQLALLRDAFCR